MNKKEQIMRYISFIAFVSNMIFSGYSYSEGILELKGKVLDECR